MTSVTIPTPSPTPWLPAFSRITLIPAIDFWWSGDGCLYYESHDHLLWSYDPVTREAMVSSVESPVPEQPLPPVLSLIPEGVPEHQVFLSPSGDSALYVTVTLNYGDGAEAPVAADGEMPPTRITSDLWYISREETVPRWLTNFEQVVGFTSWSEDESRVLLFTEVFGPVPCILDGWLIDFPEGEMWHLYPVSAGESCRVFDFYRMAPDGQKVLFGSCELSRDGDRWTSDRECEFWVRWLREGHRFDDDPVQVSTLRNPYVYWLPNSEGLLVLEDIPPHGTVVVHLYDLNTKSWVQLTDVNVPYMQMDSIARFQFSPDLNYIAWNGRRGLQCFSLCPAGGDLLGCR